MTRRELPLPRGLRRAVGLLLIALCATVSRSLCQEAPIFRNRAITENLSGRGRELIQSVRDPDEHRRVSENALIIRNPVVLAALGDGPAFAGAVRSAFAAQGVARPEADVFMKAWIRGRRLTDPRWQGQLEDSPVRLLGVINRIDLAELSRDSRFYQAELRFEFAALPHPGPGTDLNIIAEFVLPSMNKSSFQRYAKAWAGLAALPQAGAGSEYYRQLTTLLNYIQRSKMARLRTSSADSGGWAFEQFGFTGNGLVAQFLMRQPNLELMNCVTPDAHLLAFLQDRMWSILASRYDLPRCLSKPRELLGSNPPIALTLPPSVDSRYKERLRFSLSINSCVGCHQSETGAAAPFAHLAFREQDKPSRLSNFLTGSTTGNPSVDASSPGPPPVLLECSPHASVYQFNDLLRRDLYLHTVCRLSVSAPDQVWKYMLDTMGLTSFQPH